MTLSIKKGYTFDDVLLVPKKSSIDSRNKIDTSIDLGKGIVLNVPVISANMKDVTGHEMSRVIGSMGGMALLHRFDSEGGRLDEFVKAIDLCMGICHSGLSSNIGMSFGVGEDEKEFFKKSSSTLGRFLKIVCIDVAHGHHDNCIDMVRFVSNLRPDILLIAGNVCTPIGAYDLWKNGANVIKCGVGGGCFAAGTRILMSNGFYKNIEDVIAGDRVINMNGKPATVVKSFSTGIKKVVKVRNGIYHKATYVTPDHLYYSGNLETIKFPACKSYVKSLEQVNRLGESKIGWFPIGKANHINNKGERKGEQKFNLATLFPSNIEFEMPSDFNIKINSHTPHMRIIDTVEISPSYDLGYIFGTFLGDGCANLANYKNSNRGAVSWYFGLNETHIADKLAKCIKMVLGKDVVLKNEESIILVRLYFKPFADFLNTFGKRQQKHLPQNLLVKNMDYLNGIIDGLIDSDGHTEKREIGDDGKVKTSGRDRLFNSSEMIIELFCMAKYIISGVVPNCGSREPTIGGLIGANIDNCKMGYTADVLRTGKKRLMNKFPLQVSKVLEYEELSVEQNVYDLEIDDDTHSFIANNAIVHNSLCTTRINTGNGYPQLSALEEIYSLLKDHDVKIIADGGIRNGGDITKALCFSHAVMLGGLLAGTDESPGELVKDSVGRLCKKYAGSSTFKTNYIEGVAGMTLHKGPVKDIVYSLMEGLRSGMSYQGSSNLEELRKDPVFVEISNAGLTESKPHAVLL